MQNTMLRSLAIFCVLQKYYLTSCMGFKQRIIIATSPFCYGIILSSKEKYILCNCQPLFQVFVRGAKYFLEVWICRITIIFIQTKIKTMSESTLKLEKKSISVLSLKLKPRQTPEIVSHQEINRDLPWTGGEASVHGLHQ